MRSRIVQVVLVVAGLLIALYPVTVGAQAPLTCRGVVMHAGDACAKAGNSQVQTYEDRLATRQEAAPVIVVLGLVVAGFGLALLVGEVRRIRRPLPI